MEGSTSIRLRAFLARTGTQQLWLAEHIGVSKGHLHNWLSGRQPVPERHRREIIMVLRRRQLEQIPTDLFDQED